MKLRPKQIIKRKLNKKNALIKFIFKNNKMDSFSEIFIDTALQKFENKRIECGLYKRKMFGNGLLWHTGVSFKVNDTFYVTIDFSPASGQLDIIKKGLNRVESKLRLNFIDFNTPNHNMDNYMFEKPFVYFNLDSSNKEYFRRLFTRILDLNRAPDFMQRYHALALSNRNALIPATNCRFGALFVIISILNEIKGEFDPDKTTILRNGEFVFYFGVLSDNLKNLKDILLKENNIVLFGVFYTNKLNGFNKLVMKILDNFSKRNEHAANFIRKVLDISEPNSNTLLYYLKILIFILGQIFMTKISDYCYIWLVLLLVQYYLNIEISNLSEICFLIVNFILNLLFMTVLVKNNFIVFIYIVIIIKLVFNLKEIIIFFIDMERKNILF